jgi:hypothetical protein
VALGWIVAVPWAAWLRFLGSFVELARELAVADRAVQQSEP